MGPYIDCGTMFDYKKVQPPPQEARRGANFQREPPVRHSKKSVVACEPQPTSLPVHPKSREGSVLSKLAAARLMGHVWCVSFAVLVFSNVAWGQTGREAKKNRATVEWAADVDAVAPGRPFDVALRFRIDEGWHIYWQNAGDAGLAPRVAWALPEGFAEGELRFPVPKRHVDASGIIVTNVLYDEPILLTSITPPSRVTGSKVALSARVTYLVCKESCLQERADLEMSLPVRDSADSVKTANEKLFETARRALPRLESKYVKLRPSLSEPTLKPGTAFDLQLEIEVADGHHIQSHTPLMDAFIKADLFLEKVDGLYFNSPVFPEPQFKEVPVLGRISEYSGTFSVRVPAQAEELPEGATGLRIGGVFTYQACTEKGMCFPPDAVAFSLPATVDGKQLGAGDQHPATDTRIVDESRGTTVAGEAASEASAFLPVDTADDLTIHTGIPTSLVGLLAFAFLGGLILNVMPCVLPVISIKVLSFVQQSQEEPRRVFRLGLTFCAGILCSFWALALVIIALKSAGNQLGWGFQFQSPMFVIVMMSVMFVFGLSLLGVFEITLPGAAMTTLSAAEEHEGYVGAFSKGVLGTILATPCTAPFLGPALGVAFASTNAQLFAVFTFVGLGMASPFFLLTWRPAWLKYLPRPGMWMAHFKQLMGFFLMGTVVWMLYVLGHQIGSDGVVWSVAFLGFLAIAAWILGLQTPATPMQRRLIAWAVALVFVAGGWWTAFQRESTLAEYQQLYLASLECPCDLEAPMLTAADWDQKIPWQAWQKGRAERLAALGYTVYVDYTAVWCVTCLANKAATVDTDEVRALMANNCVIPLKADFSSENPDILDELLRFDRSGVPLNIIYPASRPNEPILMPEQLVGRKRLVLDQLAKAGPSLACATGKAATTTAFLSP